MRAIAGKQDAELLYKKGLIDLQNQEKLKALVAFIKAGLANHENARGIIGEYITFDREDINGMGFRFTENVDAHIQFKIFQSLFADKVINQATYNAALVSLKEKFENSYDHKTLAKIRLQMDLNNEVEEAAIAYLKRKSGKPGSVILNDYYRSVLPFVKASALMLGEALGITVGLLEYPLLMPLLIKYEGPKHKLSHMPGDNPKEIAPRANDFLEWATGIDRKSLDPLRSRIVDTGFAAAAAWIGRGIGILLSVSVIAAISVIAFPVYFMLQKQKQASLTQPMNDERSPLLIQDQSHSKIAVNLSLMNKGERSTKSYSKMNLFNSLSEKPANASAAQAHAFLTKHLA